MHGCGPKKQKKKKKKKKKKKDMEWYAAIMNDYAGRYNSDVFDSYVNETHCNTV